MCVLLRVAAENSRRSRHGLRGQELAAIGDLGLA